MRSSASGERSLVPQVRGEPDFFEDLDAVVPKGVSTFAHRNLPDTFFNIGRDGCVADEVSIDEEIEPCMSAPFAVGLMTTLWRGSAPQYRDGRDWSGCGSRGRGKRSSCSTKSGELGC